MVAGILSKVTLLPLFRRVFSNYVHDHTEKGHLEVERKFSLSAEEAAALPTMLKTLSFDYAGTMSMTDSFLPGPQEGEMMRVRKERMDDGPADFILTFKQWVTTSTGRERRETERPVPPVVAMLWLMVGRILNREPLWTFGKKRQLYNGTLHGLKMVVSIDDVYGLGKFSGRYMEIETLVPLGEDPRAAEGVIFALVPKLVAEPRKNIAQSYMEMLKQTR